MFIGFTGKRTDNKIEKELPSMGEWVVPSPAVESQREDEQEISPITINIYHIILEYALDVYIEVEFSLPDRDMERSNQTTCGDDTC